MSNSGVTNKTQESQHWESIDGEETGDAGQIHNIKKPVLLLNSLSV